MLLPTPSARVNSTPASRVWVSTSLDVKGHWASMTCIATPAWNLLHDEGNCSSAESIRLSWPSWPSDHPPPSPLIVSVSSSSSNLSCGSGTVDSSGDVGALGRLGQLGGVDRDTRPAEERQVGCAGLDRRAGDPVLGLVVGVIRHRSTICRAGPRPRDSRAQPIGHPACPERPPVCTDSLGSSRGRDSLTGGKRIG